MKAKFQNEIWLKQKKSLVLTRRDVRNTIVKCLCNLKRAILFIWTMLHVLGNWRIMNNSIQSVGHHACKVWQAFGMSGQQPVSRRAWSLALTWECMEFPWNPGVHSHWLLGLGTGSCPPLGGQAQHVSPFLVLVPLRQPVDMSRTEWAGGGRGNYLGQQLTANQSRNHLKCGCGWENAHSASKNWQPDNFESCYPWTWNLSLLFSWFLSLEFCGFPLYILHPFCEMYT